MLLLTDDEIRAFFPVKLFDISRYYIMYSRERY